MKVAVIVGGDKAPYAAAVEYGTENQPAQPYHRPAAAEGRKYRDRRYEQLARRYR